MSRFKRLSQTIWYCQYHIVWVPKYRFRVLTGKVAINFVVRPNLAVTSATDYSNIDAYLMDIQTYI